MNISRSEWKMLVSFALFGAVWIWFVVPSLVGSEWFVQQIPPVQFLLVQIGQFLLISVFLGLPLSLAIQHPMPNSRLLRASFAGILLFSLVLDLWAPPFHVNLEGALEVAGQSLLAGAGIDATLVYLWSHLMPQIVNTSMMYFAVYLVSPILALLASAFLLRPDDFKRMIRTAVG